MKMFKKLMAVALAGVMALAVLTGCGSTLNEKELIKQMNDQLTVNSMVNPSYKGFKEFKADKEMDAKAVSRKEGRRKGKDPGRDRDRAEV